MRLPLALALFLTLILSTTGTRAAESYFHKDDVIALVGGEDMVAASEYGYLELLLTRALPDDHLRFRNLAWEGDTVFEQRRDLNFPTWEEQLDKIGATVVIAQFGQMESLAGKEKLPEFIAAYAKLIERFRAGGKRRVVLIGPTALSFGQKADEPIPEDFSPALHDYIRKIGDLRFSRFKDDRYLACDLASPHPFGRLLRDGFHLSQLGHSITAQRIGGYFAITNVGFETAKGTFALTGPGLEPLRQLIIAKNRLWFDYWRPQNWAFLAGDRISQPSSRDHLDPSKRWFPPEREEFLPLIEAQEKQIDTLAQKLSHP